MSSDDKTVGFWLYNRPYVWVPGKNYKTCRRLYLLHGKDEIYTHTRPGFKKGNWGPFGMGPRRIEFRNYKYIPDSKSYSKISMIDLWSSKERKKKCQWGSRYFEIYIQARDGPLKNLEVRKNGLPFHPAGPSTLRNYLRKAGKSPGDPDFVKKPNWFKSYKQNLPGL